MSTADAAPVTRPSAARALALVFSIWAAWAACVACSVPAHAAKLYRFAGKVTGIHGNTVAISHGLATWEFDRSSPEAGSLKGARVGDEVTVFFSLDVRGSRQNSSQAGRPRQQPGQLPGPVPGSPDQPLQERPMPGEPDDETAPGEKKQNIIDDRAFYDAGIEPAPSVDARLRA